VVETIQPTQFKKFKDKDTDTDHLPGTIRVRTTNGEVWASPADPTQVTVPLYGEQVVMATAPSGTTEDSKKDKYYYFGVINTHGLMNNSILPFLQDQTTKGGNYNSDSISVINPGKPPQQLSFEEKVTNPIQPYQGDIIRQGRFGTSLRFSSTVLNIGDYEKKPFWKGNKAGEPFFALTCGLKGDGDYFTIEDPNQDKSFIYLTTDQKITKFTLSQQKIGTGVRPIGTYDKPQAIINSDRLILNAKKDEIVLVSNKDVKVATPKWSIDMDEFFTLFEELLTELQKTGPGAPNQYIVGIGLSIGNPLLMAAAMKLKAKLAKMKQI
tara:strand:+ start:1075 stop:2046 length:972 start_codon:yes stop_codon:yes gene_type:complete